MRPNYSFILMIMHRYLSIKIERCRFFCYLIAFLLSIINLLIVANHRAFLIHSIAALPITAVLLSSIYGGFGPGLFSMGLTTFGLGIFALEEARLIFYFLIALSINGLGSYVRALVHQLKSTRDQLDFLTHAATTLNESLETPTILEQLIHLSIPKLADGCSIHLVNEQGELKLHFLSHSDPEWKKTAEQHFKSCPQQHNQLSPIINHVLETGTKRLFSDLKSYSHLKPISQHRISCPPDLLLSETSNLDEFDEIHCLQNLGIRSFIIIPLIARHKALGTISFFSTHPRRIFDSAHLKLAENISSKAARALSNAALYGEAQRAIKIRENLTAIVAHDLKNPLTSIQLNTSLLLRTKPAEENFHLIKKLNENIQTSTYRMNSLISDILDFGKTTSGHFVLDRKPAKIAPVIQETIEMLRPMADQKHIEIHTRFSNIDQTFGNFDRERISQTVSNLIGNAIKFTDSEGSIEIVAKNEGNHLLCSIADSGPGIAPQNLNQIFDWYWQENQNKKSSSGLGLSIAKGIIEAHGGQIWVNSLVGKGSTFYFTLPVFSLPQNQKETSPLMIGKVS